MLSVVVGAAYFGGLWNGVVCFAVAEFAPWVAVQAALAVVAAFVEFGRWVVVQAAPVVVAVHLEFELLVPRRLSTVVVSVVVPSVRVAGSCV